MALVHRQLSTLHTIHTFVQKIHAQRPQHKNALPVYSFFFFCCTQRFWCCNFWITAEIINATALSPTNQNQEGAGITVLTLSKMAVNLNPVIYNRIFKSSHYHYSRTIWSRVWRGVTSSYRLRDIFADFYKTCIALDSLTAPLKEIMHNAQHSFSREVLSWPRRGPPLTDVFYSINHQSRDEMEMQGGMAKGRFRASVQIECGISQWLCALTSFCGFIYLQ